MGVGAWVWFDSQSRFPGVKAGMGWRKSPERRTLIPSSGSRALTDRGSDMPTVTAWLVMGWQARGRVAETGDISNRWYLFDLGVGTVDQSSCL